MISLLIADILKEAGLAPHALNVLPLPSAEDSARLVKDPRIAMVSLPAAAGWGGRSPASAGAELKRFNMELGGGGGIIGYGRSAIRARSVWLPPG